MPLKRVGKRVAGVRPFTASSTSLKAVSQLKPSLRKCCKAVSACLFPSSVVSPHRLTAIIVNVNLQQKARRSCLCIIARRATTDCVPHAPWIAQYATGQSVRAIPMKTTTKNVQEAQQKALATDGCALHVLLRAPVPTASVYPVQDAQ